MKATITLLWDFDMYIRQCRPESEKLDEFWGIFDLTNIIKSDICFTKFYSSTINLFNKQTEFFSKNKRYWNKALKNV